MPSALTLLLLMSASRRAAGRTTELFYSASSAPDLPSSSANVTFLRLPDRSRHSAVFSWLLCEPRGAGEQAIRMLRCCDAAMLRWSCSLAQYAFSLDRGHERRAFFSSLAYARRAASGHWHESGTLHQLAGQAGWIDSSPLPPRKTLHPFGRPLDAGFARRGPFQDREPAGTPRA